MEDISFSQIDFGLLMPLLENEDITDISYSNNGQLWVKTLSKGVHPEHVEGLTNEVIEKLAFQCSNVMGKTFNMAHPLLDAESAELRLNFVHQSIATNGIALLIRKTPAKIRLKKDKLLEEEYVPVSIHDFLITCVQGHCNILVSGETGSGKTELIKYLASHIGESEKIISIEDTLELHLDKIYPTRDIVAMKTNNIASYSDVLVACMRQNPRWILLSEVRSGEAVMAVRNSISSGHNILSTIHSDKASSIPMRLYSLLETSQDIDQFVKSMHRYIQLGVHVKGFFSKKHNRFQREITQVVEFLVNDETNLAEVNVLYQRDLQENEIYNNPTQHLIDYLASQGVVMQEDPFIPKGSEVKKTDFEENITSEQNLAEQINQENINNQITTENVSEQVINTQVQEITQNQQLVDNSINMQSVIQQNVNDQNTLQVPGEQMMVSQPAQEVVQNNIMNEQLVNQNIQMAQMQQVAAVEQVAPVATQEMPQQVVQNPVTPELFNPVAVQTGMETASQIQPTQVQAQQSQDGLELFEF